MIIITPTQYLAALAPITTPSSGIAQGEPQPTSLATAASAASHQGLAILQNQSASPHGASPRPINEADVKLVTNPTSSQVDQFNQFMRAKFNPLFKWAWSHSRCARNSQESPIDWAWVQTAHSEGSYSNYDIRIAYLYKWAGAHRQSCLLGVECQPEWEWLDKSFAPFKNAPQVTGLQTIDQSSSDASKLPKGQPQTASLEEQSSALLQQPDSSSQKKRKREEASLESEGEQAKNSPDSPLSQAKALGAKMAQDKIEFQAKRVRPQSLIEREEAVAAKVRIEDLQAAQRGTKIRQIACLLTEHRDTLVDACQFYQINLDWELINKLTRAFTLEPIPLYVLPDQGGLKLREIANTMLHFQTTVLERYQHRVDWSFICDLTKAGSLPKVKFIPEGKIIAVPPVRYINPNSFLK